MIFIPERGSMASEATPEPAVNCSSNAADGGAADLAFTVGVITVAAAFCVISVVSLCHCVRHVLAGGTRKSAHLDPLFYTEDEVEMAELRHFPLPHTGQVPRVRTPPSPSPSPMKFLLSPPEARLSQTQLMSSRASAAGQLSMRRDPARLTRSLPSLQTLSGSRAAQHGAVEHYVEMALVSAMTASSNRELPALAPEGSPDVTEPLLAPPSARRPPARDTSNRGRRRMQRRRYPRTPLPRSALTAAASAPPGLSHGSIDTDYQSAYAPSHITDSDDQATTDVPAAAAAAATGVKATSSRRGVRSAGREAAYGIPEPRREGSELILVSRRALERLLRRPLTAAELHTGGSAYGRDHHLDQNQNKYRDQDQSRDHQYRDQGQNRDHDRGKDQDQNMYQDRDRDRERYRNGDNGNNWELSRDTGRHWSREQDDTMQLSGLQPLEDSAAPHEDSLPVRSETAGVLADTEDNLADTAGTLEDTVGTLENTGTEGNITIILEGTETLADTSDTFGDVSKPPRLPGSQDTSVSLENTLGTTHDGERDGWIPEPPSPEWDTTGEPRQRPVSAVRLVVTARSHSVV